MASRVNCTCLYNDVGSVIVVNGSLSNSSDYFCNNVGLNQGKVLSQILISLYVKEFKVDVLKFGCIPNE